MILVGDVVEKLKELPDNHVHCVITSPPYWGLRDYGVDGQIGLEPSLQEYIDKMVEVFREVLRVLRPDGVCFLNLGDSYASKAGGYDDFGSLGKTSVISPKTKDNILPNLVRKPPSGLKPKDLCGVPWRVALTLQEDGWWLRSDIVWAKPNPLPESVTDRPSKSHEYIFMLTKSAKYFWDAATVRAPGQPKQTGNQKSKMPSNWDTAAGGHGNYHRKGRQTGQPNEIPYGGRNCRTVWNIVTEAFPGGHFATFPQELVARCILAGTSEWGCCPECGAPWIRVVERKFIPQPDVSESKSIRKNMDRSSRWDGSLRGTTQSETLCFRPSCSCPPADPIPCTVLDPFLGSGTTGLVAQKMGRRWIGIELNPEYVVMAEKRIGQAGRMFDMPTLSEDPYKEERRAAGY